MPAQTPNEKEISMTSGEVLPFRVESTTGPRLWPGAIADAMTRWTGTVHGPGPQAGGPGGSWLRDQGVLPL